MDHITDTPAGVITSKGIIHEQISKMGPGQRLHIRMIRLPLPNEMTEVENVLNREHLTVQSYKLKKIQGQIIKLVNIYILIYEYIMYIINTK